MAWSGDISVTNLAPLCYTNHGIDIEPSAQRLCMRIDNLLSRSECAEIIQDVLSSHQAEAVSLDPGVRSQFIHSDGGVLSTKIWNRMGHLMPVEVDGGCLVGLEPGWRHAMYHEGQSVFAHMDYRQKWTSDPEEFIRSRISFTIYLNDDFEGGETGFVTGPFGLDGSHGPEYYASIPTTGSAVLFYQCVPEFFHTANVVKNGKKFIMRNDVMYRFSSKEEAINGGLESINS